MQPNAYSTRSCNKCPYILQLWRCSPGTKSPVCTRSKNFISRLKPSWSEKNLQTTGVLLPLRLAENTKELLPLICPFSNTYLPARPCCKCQHCSSSSLTLTQWHGAMLEADMQWCLHSAVLVLELRLLEPVATLRGGSCVSPSAENIHRAEYVRHQQQALCSAP